RRYSFQTPHLSARPPRWYIISPPFTPLLRFEVLDALALNLGPRFDAIFSNAALHWITKPEIAVSKIFGVLRPGGRFVAEFGGKGNIRTIIAAIHRAREQVGTPVTGDDPWYFPGVDEYSSLLEHEGFIVESAHLFNRPTPIGHEEEGLSGWLEVFTAPLLKGLTESECNRAFSIVEEELRPTIYRDGTWVANYVRLRVMALKP
ncbi:MAG: methyltransferase domain-containing protein, partial [Dehalococcoidia bacterium]|nr:methyltransferase domain-containing protein [Dehalococcoidia bacterium]